MAFRTIPLMYVSATLVRPLTQSRLIYRNSRGWVAQVYRNTEKTPLAMKQSFDLKKESICTSLRAHLKWRAVGGGLVVELSRRWEGLCEEAVLIVFGVNCCF